MPYVLPSYTNKVRYTLIDSLGSLEIAEPINWKDDEKEFKRSTEVHGVFTNLSNNLEFYKGDSQNDGGYDRLKTIYDLDGINAQVLLVKDELVNDEWVESYRGYLDFSTYSRQNNMAQIKFNESGIYELIKARKNEKIELNRTTDLDGDTLTPEKLDDVTETTGLDGRNILIVSKLERTRGVGTPINSGENIVNNGEEFSRILFDHTEGKEYEAVCLPISMVSEETGDVQTVYNYNIREVGGTSYEDGETSIMFYSIADQEIELTINFDIEIESKLETSNEFRIDLVTFNNGINYNYVSYDPLITINDFALNDVFTYQEEIKVSLNAGESLALVARSRKNNEEGIVIVHINKSDVILSEETYFPKSTAKTILAHEAGERILNIITGESNILKSNALGRTDILDENGNKRYPNLTLDDESERGALTGLTNGFWLRNFDDDEERPFTTSWNEFETSLRSIWQLGYGIEKIGFREYVKMEKLDYFYQNTVTINIGQPNDIKRTVAKDYFYSSLELGYDKPSGDQLYEESMGLDEYNIKGNYTTPITRVENQYKATSKYRADSYGMEFARRKPQSAFPNEDTRYDKTIFVMDLKRNEEGGLNYEQRKWEDDFEKPIPFDKFTTGTYSPETATNLRFSPLNCLLRWGFWVKGGLEKYKDKYIRYISTEGNSTLKTQIKGSSNEYSENGEVLISDLDKSLFIPEYIEFEYSVDSELLRTINGTSVNANGEKIMNYYGLVEFINEDGLLEYGFLMELKPNNQGQWKLLKANKKARAFRPVPPTPPVTELNGFDYKADLLMEGDRDADPLNNELNFELES